METGFSELASQASQMLACSQEISLLTGRETPRQDGELSTVLLLEQ